MSPILLGQSKDALDSWRKPHHPRCEKFIKTGCIFINSVMLKFCIKKELII